MRRLLPLLLFIFIPLFLSVNAQQISLSISPPLIETVIKPGKTILVGVTVQNLEEQVSLRFSIKSFSPKGNKGEQLFTDSAEGPIRFSLDNADLQLDQSFVLPSKESKQALLRITIPEGAPTGDYYYTLFADTSPQSEAPNGSRSITRASIGANLLITVSSDGVLEANGIIKKFYILPLFSFIRTNKPIYFVETGKQIPVTLLLENKGKNTVKPKGTVEVTGLFGQKKIYQILSQNILSNSERIIRFTPSTTIDNQKDISGYFSGLFFGRYLVNTTVSFGEQTPAQLGSLEFIAFPFTPLIWIGVSIGIMVFISFALRIQTILKKR